MSLTTTAFQNGCRVEILGIHIWKRLFTQSSSQPTTSIGVEGAEKAAEVASMASSATTFPKQLLINPRRHNFFKMIDPIHIHIQICSSLECSMPTQRLFLSSRSSFRGSLLPVLAVGSGWDSSITEDERKSELSLSNVKISVVSRDAETINVRVDLPGKETQKVFDDALTSLARDAPPVPGFRRSKGGRTSNITNSILIQMLGKSRVTKFVLQEILSITIGDFVEKENLKVNPEIKTTQSEEELESSFEPGSEFGFNVVLRLQEKSDADADATPDEPS